MGRKRKKFVSVDEVLRSAQRGDLIEIKRFGYKHWAVYVGDGDVVHVHKHGKNDTMILRQRLVDVAKENPVRVNNLKRQARERNLSDKENDGETTASKAEEFVGKHVDYRIIEKNCEYFVTFCRFNTDFSTQVDTFVKRTGIVAAVGGAITVAAGGIYCFFKSGISNRSGWE